jgi:hypothetical protein
MGRQAKMGLLPQSGFSPTCPPDESSLLSIFKKPRLWARRLPTRQFFLRQPSARYQKRPRSVHMIKIRDLIMLLGTACKFNDVRARKCATRKCTWAPGCLQMKRGIPAMEAGQRVWPGRQRTDLD